MTEQRFDPTGEPQNFTVPTDVNTLSVMVVGGKGHGRGGAEGGQGGAVWAGVAVTPGTLLHIYVGSTLSPPRPRSAMGVDKDRDDGIVTLTW